MNATLPVRPTPDAGDERYRGYFDGLRNHEISLPRCDACGVTNWPPRDSCSSCRGLDFHWEHADDVATVYTFAIGYRGFHPYFVEHAPYGVIVAQLADGTRLTGASPSADLERIACGLPVRAGYLDEGDFTVLQWVLESEQPTR